MKIDLKPRPDDDAVFLQLLGKIVAEYYKAPEVFLVRIDNHFDHKWLGFAGKAKVGLDTGLMDIDGEVRPVWKIKEEVTIPPFSPNRVLEQLHFKRADGGLVLLKESSRRAHSDKRQPSAKNLKRRVLDFCPRGLLLWFSSGSATTRRGSILAYHTHDGRVCGWYGSFVNEAEWKTDRVKNMDRDVVERIVSKLTEAKST